jgi:hypothetical protein
LLVRGEQPEGSFSLLWTLPAVRLAVPAVRLDGDPTLPVWVPRVKLLTVSFRRTS